MSNSLAIWPTFLRRRPTRSRRRRIGFAALERVKELAAAYAGAAEPPPPVEARDACRGRHSLAARAARSVCDAAAGVASVLIVGEAERGEAERLVGAHCRVRQ
jgi:hypothetical protein